MRIYFLKVQPIQSNKNQISLIEFQLTVKRAKYAKTAGNFSYRGRLVIIPGNF